MQGIAGADLFPEHVVLDLPGCSTEDAISRIAKSLTGRPAVADSGGFLREVLAREAAGATATSQGVAFPHARTACVTDIVLAAGRSREAIPFGPREVRLIFLIGTPEGMISEYLALVGWLARTLRAEAVRDRLLRAPTPEEFVAALRGSRE